MNVYIVLAQVDEEDSGPYHGHHHNGNGMRPAGVGQRHTPRHLIPRSVSEEAQLAQLSGRVGVAYDGRVDEGEQQYSQDVPGKNQDTIINQDTLTIQDMFTY